MRAEDEVRDTHNSKTEANESRMDVGGRDQSEDLSINQML